jgi:hypothetical protein
MKGDRDEEIWSPIESSALPGGIEEAGERAIESQTTVEFEAMDGVTERLFIKAGGHRPGKSRWLEEAFPADVIAATDGSKGESTARTTRGSEGQKAVQTAAAEGRVR